MFVHIYIYICNYLNNFKVTDHKIVLITKGKRDSLQLESLTGATSIKW